MVRKIQKWGIIQIRILAKDGGLVLIGGKCSENKINSKWGILHILKLMVLLGSEIRKEFTHTLPKNIVSI